jgi:hypothetical protein
MKPTETKNMVMTVDADGDPPLWPATRRALCHGDFSWARKTHLSKAEKQRRYRALATQLGLGPMDWAVVKIVLVKRGER